VKKILQNRIKDFLGMDVYLMEPASWVKADFSSNFLFKIAKEKRTSSESIKGEFIDKLSKMDEFDEVFFSKPGFLNFVVSEKFILEEFEKFYEKGFDYFKERIDFNKKKVLIECVSANPTGPLHIGHGRGGIIGDVLRRIFEFLKVQVEMEYYVNDRGRQIGLLGESLKARYFNEDVPDDGYKGKYLIDIAEKLKKKNLTISNWEEKATEEILTIIKRELKDFGMKYDRFFSETTLYEKGIVAEVEELLKEKKLVYEKEGALWFKAKEFSDNKDRVIRKKDGTPTYFLSDIAYHYYKVKRGFDFLINIWGADHHGYVKRLKGAIKAVTNKEDVLKVILYQLVRLKRQGEYISMSTREGEFVGLKEVIDEVGKDVSRIYLLLKRFSTHLDFDLEKAKEQSMDNPVYYIQYAHARICSIFKKADEKNVHYDISNPDFFKLDNAKEKEIMKKILYFPDMINFILSEFDPFFLVDYLLGLSSLFHNYYNYQKIIGNNNRMALVKTVKDVIDTSLNLLGIKPMESM